MSFKLARPIKSELKRHLHLTSAWRNQQKQSRSHAAIGRQDDFLIQNMASEHALFGSSDSSRSASLEAEISRVPSECRDDEYIKLIRDAESYAKSVLEFLVWLKNRKEMNEELLKKFNIKIRVREFESIAKSNRKKIKRENLHVSVFGSTSAGKSTLVNLLIGQPLLPSSANRCTPCCILLQGTKEKESFFTIDDQENRLQITELEGVADQLRMPNSSYSSIKVFIARSEAPTDPENRFLNFNRMKLGIMDTPGFEQPAFRESRHSIEAADAFVFVVDSVVGLNEEMTTFFRDICREYGEVKVLVVFNKWDLVYEEGANRAAELRGTYLREGRRFLRDINSREVRSDEKLDESIFFFSANHIKMLRACDSILEVQRVVFEAVGENPNLFICGGSAAGRSSVANLLMGKEWLTSQASGTPRIVSFERASDDRKSHVKIGSKEAHIVQLSNLLEKEDERTSLTEENIARVILAQDDLNPEWPSGLTVFDCTHCQSDGYLNRARVMMNAKPCTLVIVVSAQHSINNVKERIKKCLEPLKPGEGHRIVLVVNKYDLMMDEYPVSHMEERKKYIPVFAELCAAFQTPEESRKRVLFTCLRHIDRRMKSFEQYQRFVDILINYGTDSFKVKRFEPIFEALEQCSKDVMKELSTTLSDLKTQVAMFKATKSGLEEVNIRNEAIETPKHIENRARVEISGFEATLEGHGAIESTDDVQALVRDFVAFLDLQCLEKEQFDLQKFYSQRLDARGADVSERMKQLAEDACDSSLFLPANEESVETLIAKTSSSFQPGSLYQRAVLCLSDHRTWTLQVILVSAQLGMLLASVLALDFSLPLSQRILATVGGALAGGTFTFLYQCVGPTLAKKRQKALHRLLVDVHALWRQSMRDSWRQAVLQKCYARLTEVEKLEKDLRSRLMRFETEVVHSLHEARS